MAQAPPGQAAQETGEVFMAPPTSSLGQAAQPVVDFQTSGGASGEIPLNGRLEGPILGTRLIDSSAGAEPAAAFVRYMTITSGAVAAVSVLRPTVGIIGRPFLTCAATRYTYRYSPGDESTLEAFMVLDARHPGSVPAPLPGMAPVTGHPGVLQSRLASTAVIARRVPGAWLLVASGRELSQRLTLLAHLTGSVHLRGS
jgi:hypothetical protein